MSKKEIIALAVQVEKFIDHAADRKSPYSDLGRDTDVALAKLFRDKLTHYGAFHKPHASQ